MSGHNAFNQMVTETTTTRVAFKNHIKREDFEQWKKLYTFDGLRGIRYGQSFCNHFVISDNLLYFSLTVTDSDTYIQEHYLERS